MVPPALSLSKAPKGYWIFTHSGVLTLLEDNWEEEVRQKMKKGRDKETNRIRLMFGPMLRLYYEQIK